MTRRATILLVDDDDADLMIAARRLRAAAPDRYRLLQATNLEEAVATLKVSPVDAVVLDLNLGASAGPDTVARLRREAEHTLIIAITGHSTPDLETACLAAGADQFLDKNAVAAGNDLMHTLEFALRKPQSNAPNLAGHARSLLANANPDHGADVDEAVGDLEHPSAGRLQAAARRLVARERAPTELFARLLEEASDSREPTLTLGALAVYLAQEYYDALQKDS